MEEELTRETVNRILHAWCDQELMEVDGAAFG
jgi:hypothetical protein